MGCNRSAPASDPEVPRAPASNPLLVPIDVGGAAQAPENDPEILQPEVVDTPQTEDVEIRAPPPEVNNRPAVHVDWLQCKGSNLEPLLAATEGETNSPARLVDARFILCLAGFDKVDGHWCKVRASGRMVRRQDLSDHAFLPLADIQAAEKLRTGSNGTLRIVVVSYPWHQPDHPDPQGFSLGIISYALASLMNSHFASDGIIGMFIDFMSLMQKDAAGERTPVEKKLFGQALESLADIYSHLHTMIFKVSSLPEDYPQGFTFPEGCIPNKADYHSRGWCFCESSMAGLAKDTNVVLDLGKLTLDETEMEKPVNWGKLKKRCVSGRAAPIPPAEFELALEKKSFTSKKADLPTVAGIYKAAFEARLGEAKELWFTNLGWGDSEAESLARVLASGAAPLLQGLYVHFNKIGDKGAAALAGALSAEVTPNLREVRLQNNMIGDEGMRAWAAAIDAGTTPLLHYFYVFDNPGDHGLVSQALKRRASRRG